MQNHIQAPRDPASDHVDDLVLLRLPGDVLCGGRHVGATLVRGKQCGLDVREGRLAGVLAPSLEERVVVVLLHASACHHLLKLRLPGAPTSTDGLTFAAETRERERVPNANLRDGPALAATELVAAAPADVRRHIELAHVVAANVVAIAPRAVVGRHLNRVPLNILARGVWGGEDEGADDVATILVREVARREARLEPDIQRVEACRTADDARRAGEHLDLLDATDGDILVEEDMCPEAHVRGPDDGAGLEAGSARQAVVPDASIDKRGAVSELRQPQVAVLRLVCAPLLGDAAGCVHRVDPFGLGALQPGQAPSVLVPVAGVPSGEPREAAADAPRGGQLRGEVGAERDGLGGGGADPPLRRVHRELVVGAALRIRAGAPAVAGAAIGRRGPHRRRPRVGYRREGRCHRPSRRTARGGGGTSNE
mmetsp:Transcript_108957/g.339555  ORF Transcript_108957/g.339555 Transcript_108957/m.339555 type:complete len:425 (+) Transcript_108957:209-1483(+)